MPLAASRSPVASARRQRRLSFAEAVEELPLRTLDAFEQRVDGGRVGQALFFERGRGTEVVLGGIDFTLRQTRQTEEIQNPRVLLIVSQGRLQLHFGMLVVVGIIEPQARGEGALGEFRIDRKSVV